MSPNTLKNVVAQYNTQVYYDRASASWWLTYHDHDDNQMGDAEFFSPGQLREMSVERFKELYLTGEPRARSKRVVNVRDSRMNTIIITELKNGLYVCNGDVWRSLDTLHAHNQLFWRGAETLLRLAAPADDAFWMEAIRNGTAKPRDSKKVTNDSNEETK